MYRKPYLEPGESRRPTLTWPRQIPFEGDPPDVTKIVDDYSKWLAQSTLPKLFINADPGAILVGPQREFCRKWPNQREVTVKGVHFIQEDSPHEIGAAIAEWYRDIIRSRDVFEPDSGSEKWRRAHHAESARGCQRHQQGTGRRSRSGGAQMRRRSRGARDSDFGRGKVFLRRWRPQELRRQIGEPTCRATSKKSPRICIARCRGSRGCAHRWSPPCMAARPARGSASHARSIL